MEQDKKEIPQPAEEVKEQNEVPPAMIADDITLILDAAVNKMLKREDVLSRFDWIQKSYEDYLDDLDVVLIGGSGQVSRERIARWSGANERSQRGLVFVQVNGHAHQNDFPLNILYHTCVAQPNISPEFVYMLSTQRIEELEFVWLNYIDGNHQLGNIPEPAYYDFITALRHCAPRTNVGFFAQGEWDGENPYGWQYEWLNALHKKFATKFFTGLVAFADLLRYPIRRIFVCGMDLFIDRTEGSLEGFVESHAIRGNVDFVRTYSGDSRVEYDLPLKEALKRYGV